MKHRTISVLYSAPHMQLCIALNEFDMRGTSVVFIQYMTSLLLSDIHLKMHNECFIMHLFCSFATLCAGHVLICDMDMMKFLLKS
jgi:hypothetical protein